MPVSELVVHNLTSPAVLAFVLGVLAVAVRGDLRLPDQVSSLVSIYLLLAIGIKGVRVYARSNSVTFGHLFSPPWLSV